jgi:acyl carrier protein
MKNKILELVTDAASTNVAEDSTFLSLGLESLEFLELIRDVEQLTGKKILDEQIVAMQTVGDLCAAVGL